MLTLKRISDNPQEVINKLSRRGFNASDLVQKVLDLNDLRKSTQNQLDGSLSEVNRLSKEIGALMKSGNKVEAESLKEKVATSKDSNKDLEITLNNAEDEIKQILLQIPNIPNDIVPDGRTAEDNLTVKTGGEIKKLGENALPHWDLCEKYDIIDFKLGVKITGAGFPVYKGKGARLQRALINFFMDRARDAGYLEIQPPYVVNESSGYGTGQLPDKEGQMYQIPLDGLYMIPTAEVPVTNIYRDTIVEESELPICMTAYSACFRREAGSYGKDVRGLNRLHQFDKVEIVRLDRPEHSYTSLQEMVNHVESLVNDLGLPWRILRLCAGDMGFTSALTYDFEVYSIAQERWLEVSSVSNFEDFQANRLKCRYKDAEKGTRLVHTLNGSALALPRIVAAILENNQTPEGIIIPEVLRPYTGFDIIN